MGAFIAVLPTALLIGLTLLPRAVHAQEWSLETLEPGGFLAGYSLTETNGGDIVVVGQKLGAMDSALVTRCNSSGVTWSRILYDNGGLWPRTELHEVMTASNGDIIAVGQEMVNLFYHCLIARLDPNGNLLWSTSVTTDNDYHTFMGVCESATGDLYAVGWTGPSNQSNEVIAKFDASGNLLWFRELDYPGNQLARCPVMQGDSVVVLSKTTLWASDLALIQLDQTGNVLLYRSAGTGNNEFPTRILPDSSGGFVVSYLKNSNQPGIIRFDGDLIPSAPALIVEPVVSFNSSGGFIWYASDGSAVIAGQGWDGSQGFAIAMRVSLSTGTIAWQRSFTTSAFVADCVPSSASDAIALTCPAAGLNANGSYPINMNLIDAATGIDLIGGACAPLMTLPATTSWANLGMQDHSVAVLSPATTIRTAIPVHSRTLLMDVCASVPLPVELIHFEGIADNSAIILNWTTASESDNDRYEIERSADHFAWDMLDALPGQGTSLSEHRYQWVDTDPTLGMNYYRLRQVDDDGSIQLSEVVAVEFAPRTKILLIGQNPVLCGQMFHVRDMATIHDMTGRKLSGPAMTFTAPSSPGAYLLRGIDGIEVFYAQ